MKVVHVIPSLRTGGAAIILTHLLPALAELGVEVSVLVYDECHSRCEAKVINDGIKLLSMGCANKRSLRIIPTLHHELSSADVAHVHLSPAMWQAAVASLDLKTPMVYSIHTIMKDSSWKRPFKKWALGRYAAIVTPLESQIDIVKEWLGPERSARTRVVAIPHGVKMERLRNARRAPGFGTEQRVITMISKFDDTKDQRTLIRAIPLLTDPNVSVVFIGDGPALKAHREYARALGVADRVQFLGTRDDIPSLIAGTSIGVQSSHREVFALSALELMAAGKPVIGSDITANRDLIADAGLLFPEGDETKLAAHINRLLDEQVFYREVSEKCLVRSDDFSVELAAERYFDLYSELINSVR